VVGRRDNSENAVRPRLRLRRARGETRKTVARRTNRRRLIVFDSIRKGKKSPAIYQRIPAGENTPTARQYILYYQPVNARPRIINTAGSCKPSRSTITGLPTNVENSVLRKPTNFNSVQDSVRTRSKPAFLQKPLFQSHIRLQTHSPPHQPQHTNSNRIHIKLDTLTY